MTSPAQELRDAATKLRTLATAASAIRSGRPTTRWHFKKHRHHDTGYLYAENPDGPGVRITHDSDSLRTRHGEYAAAMDPTLGLALADWLDVMALCANDEGAAFLDEALAVARQILGSTDG